MVQHFDFLVRFLSDKSLLSWFSSMYLAFLGYQNKLFFFQNKFGLLWINEKGLKVLFTPSYTMSTLFLVHCEKGETPLSKNHLTTALFGKIFCGICLERDLEASWDYLLKFSQQSQESFGWIFLLLTVCCESWMSEVEINCTKEQTWTWRFIMAVFVLGIN